MRHSRPPRPRDAMWVSQCRPRNRMPLKRQLPLAQHAHTARPHSAGSTRYTHSLVSGMQIRMPFACLHVLSECNAQTTPGQRGGLLRKQRGEVRTGGRARTVDHVDDDAQLASHGTIVHQAHTAGLYQSPVRLLQHTASQQCAGSANTPSAPAPHIHRSSQPLFLGTADRIHRRPMARAFPWQPPGDIHRRAPRLDKTDTRHRAPPPPGVWPRPTAMSPAARHRPSRRGAAVAAGCSARRTLRRTRQLSLPPFPADTRPRRPTNAPRQPARRRRHAAWDRLPPPPPNPILCQILPRIICGQCWT
jgi:hypothetical protein